MLARIRKSVEEKDSGFTLIELLVVMIIIGILAAIAIPVFLNQRKKAVDTSMKSDLRTVANEMETWYTDHQDYPTTVSTNTTTGVTTLTDGTSTVTVKVSAGNDVKGAGTAGTTVKAGTYCLTAENTKGTKAWFYDSDAGGLGTACA